MKNGRIDRIERLKKGEIRCKVKINRQKSRQIERTEDIKDWNNGRTEIWTDGRME